jgi:uncharacterized membrane protein
MEMLRRPGVIVFLILLLAFGLRVYHSDNHGLYLDEKYTLVISQGVVMEGANQKDVFFTPGKTTFTPREFWKEKTLNDFFEANMRGDIGNSPAYYAVLWVWMEIFGLSDFSARFPSVLFSTLVVGLVYLFVRRHFRSEPLALVSAFLAAIEPFFIAYSHMARNYSMSFFLTLLATHLFLLILERNKTGKPVAGLYVGYGLTLVIAILSHYLTVTVFLCHGLYALLFIRPPRRWLPFALTAVAGVAVVSLWFIYGGGTYTFRTLAYQAQLYRSVALTSPYQNEFGIILPATLANVAQKALPVWADLFIFSNGAGQIDALGIRNMAIALLFGLVAAGLVYRYRRSKTLPLAISILFPVLLLAGLPLFTVPNLKLVVLAAMPSLFYLMVLSLRRNTSPEQKPLVVFTILLAVIPTLFLIVMAFRNGHTYGITQRYSGFSFPYTVILVALMLRQLVRMPTAIKTALGLALVLQGYYITRLLSQIYEDRDPKYTYFTVPRGPNPHYLVAQRIKELYAPGDTILYPSVRLNFRDDVEKTYWPYSVQDAQLTNLYLPKDADYIQRLDTTDVNTIRLVKARSGKEIVLFDLKGKRHRY